MAHHMDSRTVLGIAYADTAVMELPWRPQHIKLVNRSTAANLFVSFDGINDHLRLDRGEPTEMLELSDSGADSIRLIYAREDVHAGTSTLLVMAAG